MRMRSFVAATLPTDPAPPAPFPSDTWAHTAITLENIRALMRDHHVRELPGFVPYKAVQVLIDRHKGRCVAMRAAAPLAGMARPQLLAVTVGCVTAPLSRAGRVLVSAALLG